jgi:hypothetical protein
MQSLRNRIINFQKPTSWNRCWPYIVNKYILSCQSCIGLHSCGMFEVGATSGNLDSAWFYWRFVRTHRDSLGMNVL